MKVLITGASGYIGSELAHTLADKGFIVHAFVRSQASAKHLQHPNIRIFEGDILDVPSLIAAMIGCERVFHTAGIVRRTLKDPYLFYLNNVTGTENVLSVALKLGVKKLVYTSTCGVWGITGEQVFNEKHPRISPYNNDYELSKLLAEKQVKEYGAKGLFTVIVNPTRVYGPGQERYSNAVNRFIKKWVSNRLVILPWNLGASGNYAYITDVVNGHILAMENGIGGERYILGGDNVSYKKFLQTICEVSQSRKICLRVPQWLLKLSAALTSAASVILRKDPPITIATVERITSSASFNCTKAIRQLGYHITPFKDGITQTIAHLKNKNYAQ